jgi:hypothetical protein
MIIHVCKEDGVSVGQFEELDFRNHLLHGELQSNDYYWCDGMADWKPISEYRAPGKVTTILESIPTREMKRAELASKPPTTRLQKLKKFFGLRQS